MGWREDLEGYKYEVDVAQGIRDREVKDWRTVMDFYRTSAPTEFPEEDWKLQVNWVYAWIESMLPSYTYRLPRFSCKPLNPTSVESAKTTESAITGELHRIGLKDELERSVLDGLTFGTGVLQLGYYSGGLIPDPLNKEVDKEDDDEDDEGLDVSNSSDVPYGYENGSVYVKHHPTDYFLIDPMATGLHDALWCGIEYTRPVDLVKKDPQYKGTDRLTGDDYKLPPSMDLHQFRKTFDRDPPRDQVRLYQIWDIVKRKIVTFARGHDSFLQIRRWDLPVKRYPFFLIKCTRDNLRFWNQSPVIPWLPLVNEYNLTVANRIDHMSRNKAKIAYNGSVVDESEIESLLSSRNMSLIKLDITSEDDVRKHIAPIQMAHLPPEHWQHVQETRGRISEISGQSEFDAGGTRPGERPAAEINRISAGGDHRRRGIGSRIVASMQELARDTRALMQKYYSKERVVEIIDEDGDSQWVKYSGKNLRGEFSFVCNIEEMAPETREDRQQKAGLMLQLLAPFSQAMSPTPRVDIDPILKKVSEDLDITPWVRFFPSIGPPVAPDQEWYLIVYKGQQIEPNEQDDHAFHLFTHEAQMNHPLTIRDPEAQARMRTHMEMHTAKQLAQQTMLEGQQKQQQSQKSPGLGAAPGPNPGSPSNNGGGGPGPFSGAVGGATGDNLSALLRRGGA